MDPTFTRGAMAMFGLRQSFVPEDPTPSTTPYSTPAGTPTATPRAGNSGLFWSSSWLIYTHHLSIVIICYHHHNITIKPSNSATASVGCHIVGRVDWIPAISSRVFKLRMISTISNKHGSCKTTGISVGLSNHSRMIRMIPILSMLVLL